ncbi:MAG: hypothetical protein H9893_06450 [Candidatus Niameybacter stercoravium]|nr:hypothetical protein [Candidatus Niameybacter stercoravium]
MCKRMYLEKYISEKDFSGYWNLVSNEKAMRMNYGRVFTEEEARQLKNSLRAWL